MKTTIVLTIPKEIYDQASAFLARQGLTPEEAVVLFIEETVRLGRIPFAYTEAELEEVRLWEQEALWDQ